MTVATEFYNWQRSDKDWAANPWNTCSPNLVLLRNHLIAKHGGRNLGCHMDRTVVDGSTPSSHAYGAATDWGYGVATHGGPGRVAVVLLIIPWLIDNSRELGVQAVHDYAGSSIWRPPGTSGRPADGDGWRTQPQGPQMGRTWAQWIHIETPPSRWDDITPIVDRFQSEEDDMSIQTAILYQHPAYHNVFLLGPGGAVHLSPQMAAYYRAQGLHEVTEAHDQALKSALGTSGTTAEDLVAV